MSPSTLGGRGSNRPVAAWLLVLCAMVFVMVVLGGVTRLTHSGLSMVEWKPLLGWLPPMSEAEWESLFAKYRAFPEYEKVNAGMTLAGFKSIFWLEFVHRVWGRLIGVVFLVPFLYFLVRGRLERALRPHLAIMFGLGAAQGVLGWVMVESGLVDRPDVSQYRLAAHLALAILIYGYMFWVALGLLDSRGRERRGKLGAAGGLGLAVPAVVVLTMISGAFVAGLDAGLVYNTFPLMGDGLVPPDLFDPDVHPAILNFFEHRPAVQFDHRVMAAVTVLAVVTLWLSTRRAVLPARARAATSVLLLAVAVQATLGVATLLAFVPVWLAATHQAGALVLFTASLWALHELRAARAPVFA